MFELSSHPLSISDRQERYSILPLVSSPIIGSFFYNQGYRIPFLFCPIKYYSGIPCPFCGMTRSFMAIARGDLSQALAHHVLGPVLFIGLLIALIHIVLELLSNRRISALYLQLLKNKKLGKMSIVMLLTYYVLRLYHWLETGELYPAFINSILGKMLV